jgi:hypothetical protein
MPLTRHTVTAASRIMLPTYPFLFAGLGINYVTDADRLDQSPGLRWIDGHLMPLPGWGLVFLGAAALMVVALVARRRLLYRFALWMCLLASAAFAVALACAVLFGIASYTAPIWPAFVARCCWASERSLLTRET